jgi:PadR family transcriptional regulator, regulatory protein PadR
MGSVSPQRSTHSTRTVLQAIAAGHHYGRAIITATGEHSGTVYPILARLERDGWVDRTDEDIDPAKAGRPRRRFYVLTDLGRANLPKEK